MAEEMQYAEFAKRASRKLASAFLLPASVLEQDGHKEDDRYKPASCIPPEGTLGLVK